MVVLSTVAVDSLSENVCAFSCSGCTSTVSILLRISRKYIGRELTNTIADHLTHKSTIFTGAPTAHDNSMNAYPNDFPFLWEIVTFSTRILLKITLSASDRSSSLAWKFKFPT